MQALQAAAAWRTAAPAPAAVQCRTRVAAVKAVSRRTRRAPRAVSEGEVLSLCSSHMPRQVTWASLAVRQETGAGWPSVLRAHAAAPLRRRRGGTNRVFPLHQPVPCLLLCYSAAAAEGVDACDANVNEFCSLDGTGQRVQLTLGEKEQAFLEALSVSERQTESRREGAAVFPAGGGSVDGVPCRAVLIAAPCLPCPLPPAPLAAHSRSTTTASRRCPTRSLTCSRTSCCGRAARSRC